LKNAATILPLSPHLWRIFFLNVGQRCFIAKQQKNDVLTKNEKGLVGFAPGVVRKCIFSFPDSTQDVHHVQGVHLHLLEVLRSCLDPHLADSDSSSWIVYGEHVP